MIAQLSSFLSRFAQQEMTTRCKYLLRLAILPAMLLPAYGCVGRPELDAPSTPTNAWTSAFGDLPYDGRSATALSAFEIAEAEALQWNQEAILVSVPMTRLMEANLGLPGHIPGWFFMFMVPGSPLEYYVNVYSGKMSGATEAQPVLIKDLPYTYLPLDLDSVKLDSDDAIQGWLARGGNEYLTDRPDSQLDFRLVHLEGQEHAVWSIFDFSTGTAPLHLFSIDATTGQEVSDPFLPFR